MSVRETPQVYSVGLCHHGYRAFVITGSRATQVRRWHSGPWLGGRGTHDTAETADGVKIVPCEKGDPYASRR